MQLAEHVIFVDIDIEDESELEQFASQAAAVVGWDMRAGVILDAFDERVVQDLRAGKLGWLRYDEASYWYGPVAYSYLICVHPPYAHEQQQAANYLLREDVLAQSVRPLQDRSLPLPLGREWIAKALRRGGGRLHVDLMRLELQVHVTEQMCTQLLAGKRVATLTEDARDLLAHGYKQYELFIPAGGAGQVSYRRLH